MVEAPDIRRPRIAGGVAGTAAALALAIGLWSPAALAAGWLVAWISALSVAIGAAIWLLIGRLTGGAWLDAAGPGLRRFSRAVPFVALAGVLLPLAAPALYPWWGGYEGLKGEIYLAPWPFLLRALAILILWSGIGWLAPRPLPPVVAGLLLTLYGISVGFAGLDWILSRDPHFFSTAFGMLLAAMQLGMAMAAVAVAGLRRGVDTGAVGGLMLACALGAFYLSAMQFLVHWSGNLPFKAAWFVARSGPVGNAVIVAALLAGVVAPFALMIGSEARARAATLARAGGLMLAGGVLHLLWLAASGEMIATALAAFCAATLAAVAVALWRERRS